jgi:hypothetical protein
MSIKCPGCGSELQQLTNSHIKAKHPEFVSVSDFKNHYQLTTLWSEGVKEKFIDVRTGVPTGKHVMTDKYYDAMKKRGNDFSGRDHWNYGNITSQSVKDKIAVGITTSEKYAKSISRWYNDNDYREYRMGIINNQVIPKGLLTRAARGQITRFEDKPKFAQYCILVNRITQKSLNLHKEYIDPNHVLHSDNYTIDHKFSKFEGFAQNIPPEVIGSKWNLEPLLRVDNSSKRTKCSITIEALLQAFNSDQLICQT